MAEIVRDKTGRVLFTKQMREEGYTILAPNMLPVHFKLFAKAFQQAGYNVVPLTSSGREIVNEGLHDVHNDTCYPALLVIGQLINALKSGKYDLNKVALMITQTGGGCRASNYIHLLRKALKKTGFEDIPVISLNLSGMEKNPGFSLTLPLVKQLIYSIVYGDLLMMLANQTRPYENNPGDSDAAVDRWADKLVKEYQDSKNVTYKKVQENIEKILCDFDQIPITPDPDKIKVGIVGEIFVKYAPLGNNNLEAFLQSEGVEVVVPGLMDFVIFKVDNRKVDPDLYGGGFLKHSIASWFEDYLIGWERDLHAAIARHPRYHAGMTFDQIKEQVKGYVGYGNKMGEGWLLTAEMLELIHTGTPNIVCTQPFGCLPNHVAGKGMIRLIKENNPTANIVAIDYDPGATAINQENRIKLMIANAKRMQKLSKQNDQPNK
ncbi:MAG TPA: 2-hydroxyacyl-CoA dehydratase [Candidatus Egerieicola faecale]|uniref:2-hydroxyacyl-CoA dehydratase n=1 Tax=Candidatus Egerieicola faecale TaxID=2840774 RepID=A0A9D1ITL2_9FIRM|nr:2-hydroxyacyl-CoA dehydratase [Candidatus Egerieicola faecale]